MISKVTNKKQNSVILGISLGLALLVLFPATEVRATPAVSGVSDDSIDHSQTLIITGSGFGTKSPAAPLLWDDCTNNPSLGTYYNGWLPTDANQGSQYNMAYRDASFLSGRSISLPNGHMSYVLGGAHAISDLGDTYNGGGNVCIGKNITSHSYFIHFYYRVDPQFDEEDNPTSTENMKELVLTDTQGSFYPDGWGAFGYAAWCGDYVPDENFTGDTKIGRIPLNPAHQSAPYSCSEDGYTVMHNSPINGWIKMQWEGQYNDTYDGPQYSLTTYPDGHRTYQSHYGGELTVSEWFRGPWYGYPKEDDLEFIGLGGFARVPRENNGINSFRYFAGVYMDITHARVMLGDNQDYSNCTIMEPQIPSAWSDTSITVTTNLGQLTEPAVGYLFVFDSDDNHNASGYPVSIGYCPYFVGDLNNDCVVNFKDVNMVASDWLLGDYNDVPVEPNSDNLVAFYEFEGNANDSSGNELHGTCEGGADPDVTDPDRGKVLSLNGSSAYVLVADDEKFHIADEITVATWVKPADTWSWRTIISKFGTGDTRKHLYLVFYNLNLRVSLEGACRDWVATNGITDDTWTHLAVTYDGSAVTVWLNGEYENSIAASGTLLLGGNTNPLYIGTPPPGLSWNEWFDGLLDNIRIYDYALLETEIAYLAGRSWVYHPLESIANLYDEEPTGSKRVNLKDFAVLADDWLKDE